MRSRRLAFALPGAILVIALALRLYGIDWDQGRFFHPDERFILLFKLPEMAPLWPPDLGLLLDPARSPWNPRWFAYGTFPIYLLKLLQQVASALDPTFTLEQMRFLGRGLSAVADTGSVLLVYLLGVRLYDRRTGLLAAALAALAVLHIQLSHFTTFDVQLTFWVLLALYGAAHVMQRASLSWAAVTGVALGLGLATKITIAPLAVPVLAALLLYVWGRDGDGGRERWPRAAAAGALISAVACVAFVAAQPYGLLDWTTFLRDTREQSEMALRIRDFPYTRQYIDTAPLIYQAEQLTIWGLGVPAGAVAMVGLAASVISAVRRRNPADLLLLSWVVTYLALTGPVPVKFMRYMLPVLPVLLLMGARLLTAWWGSWQGHVHSTHSRRARLPAGVIAALLLATAAYALAFVNIYRGEHPAIAMSAWINQHVQPGSLILKEHWEEGIPGLDRYRSGELKLYEPDTPAKLTELASQLETADYIVFFSNRLYGTVPRLDERYPMSREYYRALFAGELGYELAHVTQSYPSFLGVTWRDDTFSRPDLPAPAGMPEVTAGQTLRLGFADESFTAYDHPMVMLFRRARPVSAGEVISRLAPALQGPVRGTGSLLMAPEVAEAQRAGGTWSTLFREGSPGDRFPLLVWLLALELVGLLAFPLAHALFPGFPDRGYLLAKGLGVLLLAYPVWLLTSLRTLPFDPLTILASLCLLAAGGVFAAWRQRAALLETLRVRWRFLCSLEALFLLAFFAFVLVRMANPDLWHPARGGEKPMDLAYLNAIVRSTYMPPYDPWFSGGYINYYYFGQFMVATLIKLTGVVPAIAYNLAVPTLFALLVGNACAAGCALAAAVSRVPLERARGRVAGFPRGERRVTLRLTDPPPVATPEAPPSPRWLLGAGLASALLVAVVGNLDGAAQLLERVRRLAGTDIRSTVPGVAGLIEAVLGIIRAPGSASAPFTFDYWRSRAMGAIDPTFIDSALNAPSISIVEFPFFTFLFADLHAHLIALPFTVLALGFAVQAALGPPRGLLPRFMFLAAFGLVIGALRWTNSWDYPAYLAIAIAAIAVGELTGVGGGGPTAPAGVRSVRRVVAGTALQALLVYACSSLFFRPFQESYELFFAGGLLPSPEQTPLGVYLEIHGLFLFLILGFLGLEVGARFGRLALLRAPRVLVARYRPLRAWRLMRAVRGRPDPANAAALVGTGAWTLVFAGLAAAGLVTAALQLTLLVLLALLALAEIRHPTGRGAAYLLGLALIAVAAGLGLVVEVVKLDIPGEVQRMNNVFKLYLQAWVLYAFGAAFALVWVLRHRRRAEVQLRPGRPLLGTANGLATAWLLAGALLFAATLVYPALATPVRIADRFNPLPPALNGMAYMETAVHREQQREIELKWDRDAIAWVQREVSGSPVFLEASTPIYRWGSRVSIYTGLPTVLGWDWHQSQQRWDYRPEVEQRKQAVAAIYSDPEPVQALALLDRYQVRYIYLGALERAFYPASGLRKFDQMVAAGRLSVVYRNPEVTIYEVTS